MKDIKKIQEFFSKSLEENTWPEELTSRYSDEYRFELEKVTPTYQDKPGRAKYRVIDIESGELKGTPVFGSISSLQSFADDLIKPQGGTQSTNLGEMDYDTAFGKVNEYDVYMPSQEEVDKFFALTNNETHYLNSKPVMGQEGTFNLMPIEPWDEYDYSNWKSLVRKAKAKGKSIDEGNDKIEKLSNYGKVTPPKGGASLVGKYNSIQGKSKYDTVIFDYQEGSDKPYGIVQVEGHGIYGSDLLKRLGLRQTRSWTAGVDVYIHDGNYNPVYVSEDDFKALLDFWSGGLDREAKAQSNFYRGRGNTSGTIDEAKVDYDFSERELIRVLRQLKRGASTEIDMIKAFTKALGRDITKDELFSESINENISQEVVNKVSRFITSMANYYDYSEQDAVYAIMQALRAHKGNFQGLNEAKEEDKIDIVTMDVPLFIRVLEYAREDAQADIDLHDLAEKAILSTKQQGILQMDDYDMLVGEIEPIDESVDSNKPEKSPGQKYDKNKFANLMGRKVVYSGIPGTIVYADENMLKLKDKNNNIRKINYNMFTNQGFIKEILSNL